MNKKKINRYVLILILIVLLPIIYINFLSNDSTDDFNPIKVDKKDYSTLGINPNNYNSFGDFLLDYENFSGSTVDLTDSNFVICKKNENGFYTYIPFYDFDIKNGYFDQLNYKNLAIEDIYKSHKNGCIVGGIGNETSRQVIFEQDIAHNETKYLGDIFSGKTNVYELINDLSKFDNLGRSSTELLGYLNDITGDYENANKIRDNLCKNDPNTCEKKSSFKLYGKITDEDSNPIENVKISLLNDDKNFSISNQNGEYTLEFEYFPFSHLRFNASHKDYSDGFMTVSFNTYNKDSWSKVEKADFVLSSPDNDYIVNVGDDDLIVDRDGKKYYELKTDQSIYFIPVNGLINRNLTKWKGKGFSVKLYEFTKEDNIDNLVNVDTFNEVAGYVGNLMKTFGMPYIQFFDSETGNELFIKKSNPMILQNQIYHMKELFENTDQIYEAVTKEDMEFLVKKSIELGGYPIDFDFLTKNDFLRWPVWWTLDRKKGVWESIGSKVLSTDGLVELPFYSISD